VARHLAIVMALAGASCVPPAQPVPRLTKALGTMPAPSSSTTVPASTTAATVLPPPTAPGGEAPRPGGSPGAGGTIEATLACIRRCESGGDYGAVSPAGHAGAYQFAPSTWAGAVTRAGHPQWAASPAHEAPPEVQDAAAAQLLAERGLAPWPTPSRRCA